MAQRRMFSPTITESDAFLDMPLSTQALYFHLGMYADDDGFVNPGKIMRMLGATSDDLKILGVKRFILLFPNGVVVIKHWKINNLVRKDWYRQTQYLEERSTLNVKENGSYTDDSSQGVPFLPHANENSLTSRQRRLRKDSLGNNKEKKKFGELKNVFLSDEEMEKLTERFGINTTNKLIFDLSTYIASKGRKYRSHYATLLQWAKKNGIVEVSRAITPAPQEELTPEQKKKNSEMRKKIGLSLKTKKFRTWFQ
jgi:hypothetical protein